MVGAGVAGLSSAIVLAERGWRVRVVAEHFGAGTTSAVAGALWWPHAVGDDERMARWCRDSYERFRALMDRPGAGVAMVDFELLTPEVEPTPVWAEAVEDFRRSPARQRHLGYAEALCSRVPVIAIPHYLAWLRSHAEALGIEIEITGRPLTDLAEACRPGTHLLVHCSGLGARGLVGDRAMTPVAGQLVRVRNPGLTRATTDDTGPMSVCYVIPRGDDCIVGTTSEPGCEDTTPDPQAARDILARACALEPALVGVEVLEHRKGVRPRRTGVRLELDVGPGPAIIHNYGHGGAGITLSWGCAEEVGRLAATVAMSPVALAHAPTPH